MDPARAKPPTPPCQRPRTAADEVVAGKQSESPGPRLDLKEKPNSNCIGLRSLARRPGRLDVVLARRLLKSASPCLLTDPICHNPVMTAVAGISQRDYSLEQFDLRRPAREPAETSSAGAGPGSRSRSTCGPRYEKPWSRDEFREERRSLGRLAAPYLNAARAEAGWSTISLSSVWAWDEALSRPAAPLNRATQQAPGADDAARRNV